LLLLSFLVFTLQAWAETEIAVVSIYADSFNGRRTASGEQYSSMRHTAAHRTLPFGTCVELKNTRGNRKTYVTINDRGPHNMKRMFDISGAAARDLGVNGIGQVTYTVESRSACKIEAEALQAATPKPSLH
jgi:rare lipoprotein A